MKIFVFLEEIKMLKNSGHETDDVSTNNVRNYKYSFKSLSSMQMVVRIPTFCLDQWLSWL